MARVQVDATRQAIVGNAALAVVDGMHDLYSVRAGRVVHVDLRGGRPSRADLRRLLLGPTGRLRAPTLRVGRTVVVGYDAVLFERVLAAGSSR
ncbi:MAG TPA: ArsC family (seleno)protein [bacterium]|nr:ArsC family (seleno)protein [bacterium]